MLVGGYLFLDDEDWRPPPPLAAFLHGGEPPVYVGFGSMPGLDPKGLVAIVADALTGAGKRGLLATGGGALAAADAAAHVRIIAEAPHHKLLPLVGATVHHGGAGTTAAVLLAGKPAAIFPFFGDQPFWGRRVASLGAGPPPLDRRTLTPGGLAAAISSMDDPTMRRRAAAIGAAIRDEDGVAAAADFIERQVPSVALRQQPGRPG